MQVPESGLSVPLARARSAGGETSPVDTRSRLLVPALERTAGRPVRRPTLLSSKLDQRFRIKEQGSRSKEGSRLKDQGARRFTDGELQMANWDYCRVDGLCSPQVAQSNEQNSRRERLQPFRIPKAFLLSPYNKKAKNMQKKPTL